MADRSIGGGLLDYDEEYSRGGDRQHDDDAVTIASQDPLIPPGSPRGSAYERGPLPVAAAGIVEAAVVSVPPAASGCVPSVIPAPPTGAGSKETRVSLLGSATKKLAADLLLGCYLSSSERDAFAKIHLLIADPLTRSPDLDAAVKQYAASLHSDVDMRSDNILRDIDHRVIDVWHPLLGLHEVAERYAEQQKSLDPQMVMNYVAYMARYLAAAMQKITFYRHHAIVSRVYGHTFPVGKSSYRSLHFCGDY